MSIYGRKSGKWQVVENLDRPWYSTIMHITIQRFNGKTFCGPSVCREGERY